MTSPFAPYGSLSGTVFSLFPSNIRSDNAPRYGICAFDTPPYYGPSEIVLGTALKVLEPEFPRSSYKIVRDSSSRLVWALRERAFLR